MQQLLNHISSDFTIHSVLFLCSKTTSKSSLTSLCMAHALDYLIILPATQTQHELFKDFLFSFCHQYPNFAPKHYLVINDISDINVSSHLTLVFDSVSQITDINKTFRLPFHAVYGIVNSSSNIDAFQLWEMFRPVCCRICLITKRNNLPDECLNWTGTFDSIVLSVILPMFNVSKQLKQCIESLISWPAPYIEYLFVDDGSTDDCSEIVQSFIEKDSRIHLFRKENGGCASARQYGLDHARGRYIGFVDPDDFIDPTMFQKLLRRAMIGSYQISYCGYLEYYESEKCSQPISDPLCPPFTEGTSDPAKIQSLISGSRIAIWRCIFQKPMLQKHSIHFYVDLPRFDDLPFKFESFAVAQSVVCVPEYLYYYRLNRPGQDVSADDDRLFVHFDIFKHLDDFLNRHSTRLLYDELQIVKLNTHHWALQKIKPQYITDYTSLARSDLLHNMNALTTRMSYRKKISREKLAYFYALIFNRPKRILNLRNNKNN